MPKFWIFLPEAMYLPNIIHWFFFKCISSWLKMTKIHKLSLYISWQWKWFGYFSFFSLGKLCQKCLFAVEFLLKLFFFVRILLEIQFLVEIIYSDCVWSLLLRTFFVILVLLIWSRGRHPCMFKVILDSKIKEALVLAWPLVLKSIKVSYLFLYFLPRCPY